MRYIMVLLAILLSALSAVPESSADIEGKQDRRPAPLLALPNLEPEWQVGFDRGEREFFRLLGIKDGLGPHFNAFSCGNCHFPQNGLGGYPPSAVTIYGITALGTLGESLFLPPLGIPLRRLHMGPNAEEIPQWANATDLRKAPQLMGMGLVEAVPDIVFERLAAKNGGRILRSTETGRVNRWGSQDQFSTLNQFVHAAYFAELGIVEGDGPDIDSVWQYLLLLDHPAKYVHPRLEALVSRGETIFADIGCASCHTPTLTTGPGHLHIDGRTLDIGALRGRTFSPYSDFLLHDLGAGVDTDVHFGFAGRSEFRTSPLWGARYNQSGQMHDGASPIFPFGDSIERHGGEAAKSRDAWRRLPANDKTAIRFFLNSL